MDKFNVFLNCIKEPSYYRAGLISAYSLSIFALTESSLENYFILIFMISGIEGIYCYSKKRKCNNIYFINYLYVTVILYIFVKAIMFEKVSFRLETNSVLHYILIFFLLIAGTLDFIVGFKKKYEKNCVKNNNEV